MDQSTISIFFNRFSYTIQIFLNSAFFSTPRPCKVHILFSFIRITRKLPRKLLILITRFPYYEQQNSNIIVINFPGVCSSFIKCENYLNSEWGTGFLGIKRLTKNQTRMWDHTHIYLIMFHMRTLKLSCCLPFSGYITTHLQQHTFATTHICNISIHKSVNISFPEKHISHSADLDFVWIIQLYCHSEIREQSGIFIQNILHSLSTHPITVLQLLTSQIVSYKTCKNFQNIHFLNPKSHLT